MLAVCLGEQGTYQNVMMQEIRCYCHSCCD